MFTYRLLLALLIATICVVPIAAQTPAQDQTSSSLELAPFLTSNWLDTSSSSIDVDQSKLPSRLPSEFNSPPANNNDSQNKSEVLFGLPRHFRAQTLQDAYSDTVCFTMRSYRVARDDPKSDTTRPAGYSTCQPAAKYRVKTADMNGK